MEDAPPSSSIPAITATEKPENGESSETTVLGQTVATIRETTLAPRVVAREEIL